VAVALCSLSSSLPTSCGPVCSAFVCYACVNFIMPPCATAYYYLLLPLAGGAAFMLECWAVCCLTCRFCGLLGLPPAAPASGPGTYRLLHCLCCAIYALQNYTISSAHPNFSCGAGARSHRTLWLFVGGAHGACGWLLGRRSGGGIHLSRASPSPACDLPFALDDRATISAAAAARMVAWFWR